MTLIALILAIAPTAFAADTGATLDPALAESIIVQNEIDLRKLLTAQAQTEAQLEATRKELAAVQGSCHQDCPAVVAPAPKPKAPATVAKKPAVIVPDPAIAVLEARIASFEATIMSLQGQIAAIPAPPAPAYDDSALSGRVLALEQAPAPVIPAPYDDTGLTDRIVALETAPAPVVPEATVSYVSDFHLIVGVGAAAVLAGPIPGVSDSVSGRATLAVRPQWDIDETRAFGIEAEGSYELGGWGIRALPTFLTYGSTGEWGVGLGVGYACNVLTDEGCLAEHTGADLRGSWSMGGNVGGFITTDLEANYLGLSSGQNAMELRVVVGGGVRFGNPHPNGY